MIPTIAIAAAALLTPLVTYLVAARNFSGKIGTSEATDLWTESRSMREEYRQRIAAAETRIANLERDNNALVRENLELRAKIAELEAPKGGAS